MLRRMLDALQLGHRRRPLPMFRSTAGKLVATRAHHEATIRKADHVLADFDRFDGVLRLTIKPRSARR